jgi:hypothetical protein
MTGRALRIACSPEEGRPPSDLGEQIYAQDSTKNHITPIGEGGIYHSAVLEGLWLNVEWFWQEPLPPLMSVLREWQLI